MAYKIIDIEGVGDVYAEKLIAAGIKDTDAILEKCAKPAGRKALEEETGIRVTKDDLELIGNSFSEKSHSTFYSYIVRVNCKKDSIVLQENETVAYKWVDAKEFLEYVDSDQAIKSHNLRYEKYIETLIK